MKTRKNSLLTAAVLFFILVNTAYFWEGRLGLYAIPVFGALLLYFLILLVTFFRLLISGIRTRFRNGRNTELIVLAVILTAAGIKPAGVIRFEKFEADDLLIAVRDGVAGCRSTLRLKTNGRFIQRSVCFGISEFRGDYELRGDSIFFKNSSSVRADRQSYQFAVLKTLPSGNGKDRYELNCFLEADTVGYPLVVVKMNLTDRK